MSDLFIQRFINFIADEILIIKAEAIAIERARIINKMKALGMKAPFIETYTGLDVEDTE